jgi:hypothetical protein
VRRCSRAGGGRWKPGIRPFSLVSTSTIWERGIGRATHGAEKADCARSGPGLLGVTARFALAAWLQKQRVPAPAAPAGSTCSTSCARSRSSCYATPDHKVVIVWERFMRETEHAAAPAAIASAPDTGAAACCRAAVTGAVSTEGIEWVALPL